MSQTINTQEKVAPCPKCKALANILKCTNNQSASELYCSKCHKSWYLNGEKTARILLEERRAQ